MKYSKSDQIKYDIKYLNLDQIQIRMDSDSVFNLNPTHLYTIRNSFGLDSNSDFWI